ncbi:MSMEG_0569 family flavin-dependent oxidoreductase [Rhizobium johnstonii]|uniref:MSMEG_0569 family flavin-dependent oxidoreductase n=1 Tax=Rhizobium leguminosarum bv. viciae TaxID=387 RepID=A0A8G2MRB7_RHILV|nr:MSMEG_0569 family flavin-dependent oxidoreductase [Rhizobium leguminosarum]MBY5320279.1 MSMEG_0569 family flavin-dependent oxidoreductase [Rhizobium leguminosarum]MBY5375546.1 MSMEG_0569 family flavin-dependent oxidoreductase [Rhizobium leguminosarum]MBY5379529.1 MSMEG_0569 family flavin-dependent oxidoreductase [Rhizobium leguminosarum]MBY5417337.1 MSMEG_0569 family flavin-dependent oxidoreductase [Rhizobium leguminosarum]MBY5423539.1 MSMEG_0569 family flavin-dependent oxidoreductase [Rhiz
MPTPSLKSHYSAVVIGGGQAGLSASYYLKSHGIDHVVFEKKTVAHKWKNERWDAFCLVTPNWQCQLPDHPYDGTDPHGFMVKDEILAYVDRFVKKVDAPIFEQTGVTSLEKHGGLFRLETSAGAVTADAVVIATSLYADPAIPRAGERLPEDITQIHTAAYRNADQLPDGGVIVVGSGQSGCQIAEDLHLAGRKVHLVTGNAPRCARFYRGRDVVDWLSDIGQYDITVEHGGMTKKKHDTNHYLTGRDGGRDIDLRKFAQEGMALYGRMSGVAAGRMLFEPNLKANLDGADRVYNGINALIDRHIAEKGIEAPAGSSYVPVWEPEAEIAELDLKAEGITSVIWATGFSPDWSFVGLPIFDGNAYPVHRRGVTAVDGVYVLGLPWLWTWGSGRFLSVGRDAEHVVGHLAARRSAQASSLKQSVSA